jgi:hypothetical protein
MMATGQKERARFSGGPEGLEITIPAPRNVFALVFLGLWLVGWILGELSAIARIASFQDLASQMSLLVWVVSWTIGGAFVACLWLWMLVGKERIILGASTLRIAREVLGFRVTRVYELSKVRKLRVSAERAAPQGLDAGLRLWGLTGGLVVFDYGQKIIRFGASIDDAEARVIVERMKQRYGFREG